MIDPLLRLYGRLIVYAPGVVEVLGSERAVPRTVPVATLINWTFTFGAATPVNAGRWFAVIPSPLIPVSSAVRMARLGAVVGPWVKILKVNGMLSVEPCELVATAWMT